MRSFLSLLVILPCFVLLFATTGCGGSEPTVIEPGEGYQRTPEEQALKEELDRQRGEMGKGDRRQGG